MVIHFSMDYDARELRLDQQAYIEQLCTQYNVPGVAKPYFADGSGSEAN